MAKDKYPFKMVQQEIWDEVFRGEYNKFFINAYRRFGKDYLSIRIALELCILYKDYHCLYVFDKQEKGIECVFTDMLTPLVDGIMRITHRDRKRGTLQFTNGSRISFAFCGASGGNIRGREINTVILSEVGFYSDEASYLYYSCIFPAWKISENRTDIPSFIFAITTPAPSNFAFDLYSKAKNTSGWFVKDVRIDEDVKQNGGRVFTEAAISEIQKEMPAIDFRMEFLVDWG